MSGPRPKRLTRHMMVRVTPRLAQSVEELAAEWGVSASWVIRRAVQEYAARHGKPTR